MQKLTDNYKITSIAYEDLIPQFAKRYMLTIEEAKEVVKSLSFSEYKDLIESISEDVMPPSAQTPGQSQVGQVTQTKGPTGTKTSMPWPGKIPIEQGMEVGLKDKQTGLIMPYNVQRTDKGTKSVTVMDPRTSQQQTYNEKDFVPIPAKGAAPQGNQTQQGTPTPQTQGAMQQLTQSATMEANIKPNIELNPKIDNSKVDPKKLVTKQDPRKYTTKPLKVDAHPMPNTQAALAKLMQSADYEELTRLMELAGLKESGSGGCGGAGAVAGGGGATTSGNIASVAKPMGKIKKRLEDDADIETMKRPMNVHGKIDPNAATGELSATLADRKMKTASRRNNGKKVT